MRYRTLWLLAICFPLAGGCGGKVQPGGGSGGASNGGSSNGGSSNGGSSNGGSPSGGSPSGGSPNGGTGGTPAVSCSSAADCCAKACTLLTHAVQCPGTPTPACDCSPIGSLPTACQNALTDAYRCLLKVGPAAVKCDQNGNLAMRCGFCEPQMQAVAQSCPGTQTKCVY